MRTFAHKLKTARQATSAKPTRPSRVGFGQSRGVNSMLHLQRTIGNRAVQQLLRNGAEGRDAGLTGMAPPHLGHNLRRIPVSPAAGAMQTNLEINMPRDESEQEADHVAERVMRMPDVRTQRLRAEEEDRITAETVQRAHAATPSPISIRRRGSGVSAASEAPQIVSDVVSEPGRPLDPPVRSFMERRFGCDFSHVQIHTGSRAAESAQAINALAYTVGRDVVFQKGAYRPESDAGRRLIAHELTHVIQQGAADTSVQPDSENEFGDSGALQLNRRLQPLTRSDRRVQRQEGCYCCVSSVAIKNVAPYDNATHMGHRFDFKIGMARSTLYGPRRSGECTLEWWEKTNVPYTAGMRANTWTNMFQLVPTSPTFDPWRSRSTACDVSTTVTINDPPALAKRPGRTVTRTLEFDLKVKSGPGASCAHSEKNATATQVLTMVNGAPDWANSSFA